MSLFKTRTFWTTTCDNEESFDQNSLITTGLNSQSDYIITGSHSGILRVFKPSGEFNDNNNLTDYRPTDLVVEKIFEHPILQIGFGKFVSGSSKTQLVILQPRLLSIYTLITKEGATDHGIQNILQLNYEHKLRRSAANFASGPFGGTQNRDFICVQSLDGLLTFFEQESFVFCCFLSEFLIPAPISFVAKSDSFVTCNSSWSITSFKYKTLSEAGQNSVEDDDTGKKISCDWSYHLGEFVLDIEVLDDPINVKESNILVLGERNIYCISDSGKLKYMKRLEYSPICFTNYIQNEKIISLVVSETSTLLIYQNTSLKWSANLDVLPVSLKRAFLSNISGVLVLLSEEGNTECCYLGTEPSLFVAPPLGSQDLDFDKAGVELATLNKIIKNSYTNDIKVTNSSAERELTISISVNPHLETCSFESKIKSSMNNQMCEISIDILPQAIFEEVQIAMFVQRPLKIQPQVEFFNNLSDRTSINCYAFMDEVAEIPSLSVQVVASFISSLGVPRSVTKCSMLPPNLVLETCPPFKESEHKVTLNINQSPASLASLFPEFSGQNSFTSTTSAMGFKNVNGSGKVVTVLLAKSSERYRLQSNSFASLNLMIEQMIFRLEKYNSDKEDFSISFDASLPTNECLPYISKHFNSRLNYNSLQNELSQLSAQFRLIQKRLISKFKVKNPSPLSNLELLLQDTFTEIMKIAERLDEETDNLIHSQIELSCALHVIVNLFKLTQGNNEGKNLFESAFSPIVYDLNGQNWEDVSDASLCYLLRTVLAKSEKDKLRAAHTSFDEVKDVSKMEKHFTQCLERFSKASIQDTYFIDEGNKSKMSGYEKGGNKAIEEESLPIGTKLGESSSRLLSARKRIVKKKINYTEADNNNQFKSDN